MPIWLLFAHRQENEIRGQAIAKLRGTERLYGGGKMGWAGMVFFEYANLKLLGHLSDIVSIEQIS